MALNPSSQRRPLAVLFGIVCLDLLGFGIIIPQLGVFGRKFSASPLAVGLLISIYSLMQLFSAPILGRLSDRYGRRIVLLVSIAGSVGAYLLFGFAESLTVLFVARMIDGLSGGNISTAQAYVADVTTEKDRARGMGLIGAAFGLGFTLGPVLGGALGAWGGNRAIGLFCAGLAAINLLGTFLFLPEPERHVEEQAKRALPRTPVFQLPVIAALLATFFVFTTAFSQMEGTFSFFVIDRFVAPSGEARDVESFLSHVSKGLTDEQAREASTKVAGLFGVVGILSAVIQGGLLGRLRVAFEEKKLLLIGASFTTGGLFVIPLAPSYGWLFVPTAMLAIGSALTSPTLSSLVSVHSPRERLGAVLGTYQSVGALGRVVGPALGGGLYLLVGGQVNYWVAAALMALGIVAATRLPLGAGSVKSGAQTRSRT